MMRDKLRWILNWPVLGVVVCIWMVAGYCYEAVTDEFTALRIIKAVLVTVLGVGCVLMNRK